MKDQQTLLRIWKYTRDRLASLGVGFNSSDYVSIDHNILALLDTCIHQIAQEGGGAR